MRVPRSKSLKGSSFTNPIPLFVHGQGVFLFETYANCPSIFFDVVNQTGDSGLHIEFGTGFVHVMNKKTFKPYLDRSNTQGLVPNHGAFYWFSLDSHNGTLYAGIGEARMETVIYQATVPDLDREFLESLVAIKPMTVKALKLLRDPITRTVPLLVKTTDELTMSEIAKGACLPKANLSPINQKLYDCIAGKRFALDDDEFPEFSQAIEHSIKTPGLWCHTRLQEKAREFSKDPKPLETYLRITLGENNGESPGVPYVMEIWPIGHYSPIHSHADANAVIRVLHGSIHVQLFPFLCDDKRGIKEFAAVDFKKDDITWISPTLNQVHRLTNLSTSTETCITIQCYMYDESNDAHYDYFDYLDDNGVKQQYTPDSDMEFGAFKALMKKEWAQATKGRLTRHSIYQPL